MREVPDPTRIKEVHMSSSTTGPGRNAEKSVSRCLEALKKNNFNGAYFASGAEAMEYLLRAIPAEATVGFGDSKTTRQIGLPRALYDRGQRLISPFWEDDPDDYKFPQTERAFQAMMEALTADFFIAGINALSEDGNIVNNDVGGNRVAGMIFGPRRVILVAGTNKIVPDLEAALERVKKVAAPQNALRLASEADMEGIIGDMMKNMGKSMDSIVAPCGVSGECDDCDVCMMLCYTTIIRHQIMPRIEVVIIGEQLGL
jgi:hypothetical protein